MAQPVTEKAPLDRSDYEGLQLDTRARDERGKYFHGGSVMESPQSGLHGSQYNIDWSTDEKAMLPQREAPVAREWGMIDARGKGTGMGMHRGIGLQEAPNTTATPTGPRSIQLDSDGIEAVIPVPPPPPPRVQRICGLRRQNFFIMYGLILAIVVIASIIGGVIAGTRNNNLPSTPTGTDPALSSSNSSINANLSPNDIMVGSPIVANYYTNDSLGIAAADHNLLRVYYQSANGNVKQLYYNGASIGWGEEEPILTDAINNTGLAAYTYLNDTQQQASIFYVSASTGTLFEKRSFPGQPNFLPSNTTIDNLFLKVNPSFNPAEGTPKNLWDTFRMTAVYSEKFASGRGGRLFYHASNGSLNYVQEVIWNQTLDEWSLGNQLPGPCSASHLTATVDEVSLTLRLFYSAGNLTLQESYLNMSDPNPKAPYHTGISFPNFLSADDSDLSAVSTNGTTFLYFYDTQYPSLRELTVPAPLQQPNADTMNRSITAMVAQPALITNSTLLSSYQPLTAVVSRIGVEPYINVWFAQDNVSPESGYQTLTTTNRSLVSQWPTDCEFGKNQFNISLAGPNTSPH